MNIIYPKATIPGLIRLQGSSVNEKANTNPKNSQNNMVSKISGQNIKVGKDNTVKIIIDTNKHRAVPRIA